MLPREEIFYNVGLWFGIITAAGRWSIFRIGGGGGGKSKEMLKPFMYTWVASHEIARNVAAIFQNVHVVVMSYALSICGIIAAVFWQLYPMWKGFQMGLRKLLTKVHG